MLSSSPFLSDTGSEQNLDETADLRAENRRLLQANSELTAQLSSLRAQFDRAVSVASSVDDLASKMTNIESESTRLKNENQDLSNRLRIALDKNHELEKTVSTLSAPDFSQKAEIGRLESQVRVLQEERETEKAEFAAAKREKEMREKELASILSTAEAYFGCAVESSHTLIQCFKKEESSCSRHLGEKVVRLKRKLRRARRHSESLSEIKSSFRDELDDINGILDQKGLEFSKRVEDLEARNTEQFKQIGELNKEKEQLVKEIAEKNSQLRMLSLSGEEKQGRECQRVTAQLSETTEKLAAVMKENKELKKKLYKVSFTGKTLEKKCHALETAIRSLKAKKEQLRMDHERASSFVTQNEIRIKEVQGCLDRSRDEVAQKLKDIERLNDECVKYETELKKKERECKDLEREKDDLTQQLQKEGLLKQQLENRLQSEQDKQLQLEKTIYDTNQKLREALRPIDTSDLVPLSSWISNNLPSELQNQVTEIAKDPTLQLSVKIQRCLVTVPKWYQARCDKLEENLAREKDEHTTLQTRITTLTDFLKQLVPDLKINYDLLVADELTRTVFGEAIHNKDKEVDRARKAKKDVETKIHNICLALNIESLEDIQEELDTRTRAIKRLSKKWKQEKQNCGHLVQKMKEMEAKNLEAKRVTQDVARENTKIRKKLNESSEEIENLNDEIEKLNKTIRDGETQRASIENENTNLNETVAALQHKKEKLQRKIQSIQGMIDQLEGTFKQKVKTIREASETRVMQVTEQSKSQIAQLQAVITDMGQKSTRLEERNAELEARNSELSLKVQRLETRANAVQMESDRNRRAIESQMNAKMQYAESEYKAQIADLKAENAAFRNRIAASISLQFSTFTDGMKVSESNFESALQVIKRKLDSFTAREQSLRNALHLQPVDSIEEAITALTRRKHRY